MSWTLGTSRNSDSGTYQSRNSGTYQIYGRHGTAIRIKDISDKTFTDVLFPGGDQIKDVTFDQVSETTWTNQTRN